MTEEKDSDNLTCRELLEDGKPCKFKAKTVQGLSSHKRLSHFTSTSMLPPKKIEDLEDARKSILYLKTSGQLTEEQAEKVNLMESQLLNQTEAEKLKAEKESQIQEQQQENRSKKASVEGIQLDRQYEKLQEQTPNQINIKDLIEIKKLEAMQSKPQDNSMMVMLLQQQQTSNALTTALITGILNQNNVLLQSSQKQDINLKDELKKTLEIARELGFEKTGNSDTWQNVLNVGLNKLSELGSEVLKAKRQNPKNPIEVTPEPSQEAVGEEFREVVGNSTPPFEPTDSELMGMNFLHDEATPNLEYSYPFDSYTNFKYKPKQSPMTH